MDPSVSLARVSESLPFTFTGADLYALCSDAMLKAVTRSAREVDQKVAAINAERASRGQSNISVAYYFDHYGTDDDVQVMVTEEDFTRAKDELVPSVSLDELKHYERVRNTFEGATKKEEKGSEVQNGPLWPSKKVNRIQIPTMNGGGDHPRPQTVQTPALDSDDEYVIRTDRLTFNQSPGKPSPAKGKGKGKSREMESVPVADGEHPGTNGFQNNTNGEEDLYD